MIIPADSLRGTQRSKLVFANGLAITLRMDKAQLPGLAGTEGNWKKIGKYLYISNIKFTMKGYPDKIVVF